MIVAKENNTVKDNIPLPETGTVQAVCCGVWDLGLQKTTFKDEEKILHKVVIAWELAQKINLPGNEYDGKPYMLTKRYTLSLNEKANLRKDLESWRGHPFTADELNNGFDIEILYGINCLIGVAHEQGKKDQSRTYAVITAILPPVKGMEKLEPVRGKTDEPPSWVKELQAQQITLDENGTPVKQVNPFE